MTMTEVIPIVTSLSHADKYKLMQVILAQLAKEDGVSLQGAATNQQDPLFDIIGIVEGEETDVARRHDDYLYGAS